MFRTPMTLTPATALSTAALAADGDLTPEIDSRGVPSDDYPTQIANEHYAAELAWHADYRGRLGATPAVSARLPAGWPQPPGAQGD